MTLREGVVRLVKEMELEGDADEVVFEHTSAALHRYVRAFRTLLTVYPDDRTKDNDLIVDLSPDGDLK